MCCFDSKNASLTCAELAEATRLDEEELKRVVQSLVLPRVRVLTKIGADSYAPAADLWQSSKVRVKLAPERRSETTAPSVAADRDRINDSVQRDRIYALDATVVPIIKARKTLSHHDLVANLLTKLKCSFHSVQPKKCKRFLKSVRPRASIDSGRHMDVFRNKI
jgi:hypothetical protein